jgi:hypothetical protein
MRARERDRDCSGRLLASGGLDAAFVPGMKGWNTVKGTCQDESGLLTSKYSTIAIAIIGTPLCLVAPSLKLMQHA